MSDEKKKKDHRSLKAAAAEPPQSRISHDDVTNDGNDDDLRRTKLQWENRTQQAGLGRQKEPKNNKTESKETTENHFLHGSATTSSSIGSKGTDAKFTGMNVKSNKKDDITGDNNSHSAAAAADDDDDNDVTTTTIRMANRKSPGHPDDNFAPSIQTGRATEPGAVRIDLRDPGTSSERSVSEGSSLALQEESTGNDCQVLNKEQSEFLAMAELVDEELIRQQALASTVVATAEIMPDPSDDKNTAMPTSSNQRRRFFWQSACGILFCVVVCVVIASVVAVVSQKEDDDSKPIIQSPPVLSNNYTNTTHPITSPTTSAPTIAPTQLVWEQANNGKAMFGALRNLGPGEEASGGHFGHSVAMADLPVGPGEPEQTMLIVTYKDMQQYSKLRLRRYRHRRRLSVHDERKLQEEISPKALQIAHNQFAIFRCNATGMCDDGTAFWAVSQDEFYSDFSAWKIDISRDGSFLVASNANSKLLYIDFDVSPEPLELFGSNGTIAAVVNQQAEYMASLGRESLTIYSIARDRTVPTESTTELPELILPQLKEMFSWRPPSVNESTAALSMAALAMDNHHVVVGTNIIHDVEAFSLSYPGDLPFHRGYRVRVINTDGQQIGQTIEANDTWYISSAESLAMAANGTIIAIGSSREIPGTMRSDLERVSIWQIVDNTWVPLGSALEMPKTGELSGSRMNVVLNSQGTRIAIGLPVDDSNGVRAGRVSVYSLVKDEWLPFGDDLYGIPGSAFGQSLAMNQRGDMLLVGAPDSQANGPGTGEARIYQIRGV